MGCIVHISEADAARDFPALLRRVRVSEMVVIECEDGTEALIRLRKPIDGVAYRTIAEARELLRKCREAQGLSVVDAEFAADMKAIHDLYNQPMDSSRWD